MVLEAEEFLQYVLINGQTYVLILGQMYLVHPSLRGYKVP